MRKSQLQQQIEERVTNGLGYSLKSRYSDKVGYIKERIFSFGGNKSYVSLALALNVLESRVKNSSELNEDWYKITEVIEKQEGRKEIKSKLSNAQKICDFLKK